MKLEKEEKDLLEAFERGRTKSVPNVKGEISRYREYAKAHFQKNKMSEHSHIGKRFGVDPEKGGLGRSSIPDSYVKRSA